MSELSRQEISLWKKENKVNGLMWTFVGVPASAISAAYFFFCPKQAAETARVALSRPSAKFVQLAWGILDLKVLRKGSLAIQGFLGLHQKEMNIAGVRCLLMSHRPFSEDGGSIPQNVIFNIHGGGFMACLLAGDVGYLSQWSKATGAVVVYPFYSMAPEAPYPKGLNEVIEVYREVRAGALGFPVSRVVVSGDSAGGNLAAGLINRLIMDMERVEKKGGRSTSARVCQLPDGALLGYPSLCLNWSASPSRAANMNDPILPFGVMNLVMRVYPGKSDVLTDCGISPAIVNDTILKRFPKTFIMVGGIDPLLDDAVDFDVRLRRCGVGGELKVYQDLPHGFYSMADILPVAAEAVTLGSEWLVTMFNGQ